MRHVFENQEKIDKGKDEKRTGKLTQAFQKIKLLTCRIFDERLAGCVQ